MNATMANFKARIKRKLSKSMGMSRYSFGDAPSKCALHHLIKQISTGVEVISVTGAFHTYLLEKA